MDNSSGTGSPCLKSLKNFRAAEGCFSNCEIQKGKEWGLGAGKVSELALLESHTLGVKEQCPLQHPGELPLAHL